MTSPEIRDFTVDIPGEEVERLKRKLRGTRLPGREIVPGAGTRYGPENKWREDLYKKWTDDFDWYSVQDNINELPHYIDEFEGVKIHFLHARSETANAIPFSLFMGGPELSTSSAGLPGFCWSDWPPNTGWTLQDTARVFDSMMEKLGYDEYMVQCGDWGHFVGRELGMRYTQSCKLIHFNFVPSEMLDNVKSWTEREHAISDRLEDWYENHTSSADCMRAWPHTIGIALHDNPMGILMWVGEKYNAAADPEKQKLPSWSQAILETASLYYLTGFIMSSMLCFSENLGNEEFADFTTSNSLKVPFGYSSFLWDTEPSSKRMVEMTGNVVYYKEHDDGGHFAALECPRELVQDGLELADQEWKK